MDSYWNILQPVAFGLGAVFVFGHAHSVLTGIRNRNQLESNEWDFRSLDPEHFYAAWHYELVREISEIHVAMALLTVERRREIEMLREEEWERWEPAWIERGRFWQFYPVFRACWCCVEFPKPWMALSDTTRNIAVEKYGKPTPPLRILTRDEFSRIEDFERMVAKLDEGREKKPSNEERQHPIRRYIVQIDWLHDDPLLRPLLSGLLKLRPEGTRPHKRHTGKRAANPMHRFKQLAAWRLATKAGLNYKEARQVIGQQIRNSPREDKFDLLPDYKSAGAWKDAVDAGRKLVQRGW